MSKKNAFVISWWFFVIFVFQTNRWGPDHPCTKCRNVSSTLIDFPLRWPVDC